MGRRLFVAYDIPGWCYHRRALGLQKYAPHGWSVEIAPWKDIKQIPLGMFDVVFCLEYAAPSTMRRALERIKDPPPLVTSYNIDQGRNRERFPLVYKYADYTIFNSVRAFDFFNRPSQTCAISNGIDFDIFRSTVPWAERERKIIWCGSSAISKGKNYQEILLPAKSELESMGFETHFRPIDEVIGNPEVKTSEEQNDWYNTAQFIAWPSRADGSPNTLIEAVTTGCIPVSTPVGCVPEFIKDGVNGFQIKFDDYESFIDGFKLVAAHEGLEEVSRMASMSMELWSWKHRAAYFYRLFERLLEKKYPDPFAYTEIEAEAI